MSHKCNFSIVKTIISACTKPVASHNHGFIGVTYILSLPFSLILKIVKGGKDTDVRDRNYT